MNIFCTHDDPYTSAFWLDDKRVNKMVVETAQMLSTALRVHGYEGDDIYKSAYLNHPCTRWTRNTRGNFLWLAVHGLALCSVYQRVYKREHKTEEIIKRCLNLLETIPDGFLEPFANCSLFKQEADTTKAYRDTMNVKWANDKFRPTWQNSNKPNWYENLG